MPHICPPCSAFLKQHPDKLVVMKFSASYCKACQALDAKFVLIRNNPKLSHLPIVWAEFGASRQTRAYFRRLDVLSLPSIQFYDGGQLVENFACGVRYVHIHTMLVFGVFLLLTHPFPIDY